MGLSRKHFKIAEVLAAIFTRSQTPEDQEKYDLWEKENGRLAREVLERERYDEFVQTASRFNREEGWQVFTAGRESKLPSGTEEKGRGRRLRFVFRYAAVGIVLIACGLFYWMNRPQPVEQPAVFAYQIEPGTTGARLTMADGKTVDVVKDQTFLFKETDGTLIVTDSTGKDYVVHDIQDDKEVRNRISTLTGMEYTLTLSDGTKVYLNAESELLFPVSFKGGRRTVELSGEAYFEVAKDAKHPFVVKTGDVSIKVLGTSFNVRAYSDERAITTTLAEGKVQVFDGRQYEDIVPGEQVVYEKTTKVMTVNEVDVSRYVAWREGKFIFRNERLEDIMVYLTRWYDVKYRFADDAAKDIRIGAKLNRYDNMNPIIDMLKMNASMTITLVDGVYCIASK